MEKEHSHSGGLWIVIILALAGLALILPKQLPHLQEVKVRIHAVERHSQDAMSARESLDNCGEGLRVKLCPSSENNGLSVVFWCADTGTGLCPGMYATISGWEKTSFIRPCTEWEQCK